MIDNLTLRRLCYGSLFLLLGFLSAFLLLLPLDFSPERIVGPDIMLGLVCAWVLRRPDYVPIGVIALVFLFLDFMLQQVPGIWSLVILLGTEFLRSREASLRGANFVIEWAFVVMTILVMVFVKRLTLNVFFIEQPPLGQELLVSLATISAYPFLVAFSVFILGVRKLQPGESLAQGRNL